MRKIFETIEKISLTRVSTFFWILAALIAFSIHVVSASEVVTKAEKPIREGLKTELLKRYPNSRIEFVSPIKWTTGVAPAQLQAVTILNETARGEIQFVVHGKNAEISEGWTSFAAWVLSYNAVRRIRPGEMLAPELFVEREINVSTGQGREYRGVIFPHESQISGLEARQTIMEGQTLYSTAVEQVPDGKRGDMVRVILMGDSMTLTTQGVLEEPGFINGQVRVMANKTKRELVGMLKEGGIVEVKL